MKNFNKNLLYTDDMIISCPSCKKKFQIDENLIPIEGRNLQCGSCFTFGFLKMKKKNLELKIKDNFK